MIGQQIGPYRVLNLLGRGDIGIVYQAVHAKLEKLVAIKVLSPELPANSEMRERVAREASLQAELFHPNVVNVLNFIEDRKGAYLVMEYVQGESLEHLLKQVNFLERYEAFRISLEILDALAFMHRRGINHRHIKPGNIMIAVDGNIKVTDFGIAKVFGEKGISIIGMRPETLWYLSPEQLRGENVTAASDMYSFGIMLYQMLTGRAPFHGNSRFEIIKSHMEATPRDPGTINPNIPWGFCNIILKALAKNPQERFQSAGELRKALSRAIEGGGSGVVMPSERSLPVQEDSPSTHGPFLGESASQLGISDEERLFPGRFSRKVFYLITGMAFVIICVLMYTLFLGAYKKENSREGMIPLTFAPANGVNASSPLTVTAGNGTQASEPSLLPESKPRGAPAEINGRHMRATHFSQEQFVSAETEIKPRAQPASSPLLSSEPNESPQTGLSGTFRSEEPVQPHAAPQNADAPGKKKRVKRQQYPKRKSRKTANRTSSGKSGEKSAGKNNKGWRIIK